MTNVMVKTCLNQKIIKNSNMIQAMKNSVCPKAKVIRRPNFSESRICPNIYRMFRSVDRRHDMIIVKWHDVTLIQFYRRPNLSEYLPNVPKCRLNTRHDNREVALTHLDTSANFPLWQMRHRFNPHTGQWLSTLLHANYSAAQVYVLHPRQFIFALSCRRRSFLQVLQSTER